MSRHGHPASLREVLEDQTSYLRESLGAWRQSIAARRVLKRRIERYVDSLPEAQLERAADLGSLPEVQSLTAEARLTIELGAPPTVASPQPAVPPQPVALPEPVVRAEPVVLPEPVVRADPVVLPEPVASTEPEPVAESEPVAEPAPASEPTELAERWFKSPGDPRGSDQRVSAPARAQRGAGKWLPSGVSGAPTTGPAGESPAPAAQEPQPGSDPGKARWLVIADNGDAPDVAR